MPHKQLTSYCFMMSSQKGNVKRNRPQKYQNKTVFKNNLHDTSKKTKELNNLEITSVCKKCKNILEWKIKYKKYKVLKAPKTCTKCHKKTVKHSYHTICSNCSQSQKVCAKCGNDETLIEESNTGTKSLEDLRQDPRLQKIMKFLPERKRKSIIRYLEKKGMCILIHTIFCSINLL